MLALWLENQTVAVREVAAPTPPRGEALVRVLKAGICNTDVELTRGYYPYTGVIGHEFVGVVESEGEWRGKRVVGEINAAPPNCDCAPCRRGDRTHCERRTVLGILDRPGVFAEYLTLPFENLHAVPDSLSDDEAVFTEPLAAAFEIPEQVRLGPGQTVYVIGDGKLGLLCAQALALTGCDLTAIGKHREKLALLERRGLRTALLNRLPTQRADVVVECTGSPTGFDLARSLTRPRGALVLKSTYAGSLTVDMSRLVVDEVTVIGSRCGPFDRALRALANGEVGVTSLIQARYPLREAVAALAHAQRPGVLKVLLEIGR